MTITYDHRRIESCACVETRLRNAVEMLDRSATLRDQSYEALEKPVEAGCDAIAKLRESWQLRTAAEEKVREALQALLSPPPNVSTGTPPAA